MSCPVPATVRLIPTSTAESSDALQRRSRRWLLGAMLGTVAGACEAGDLGSSLRHPTVQPSQEAGRLRAFSSQGATPAVPPGLYPVGLAEPRDGLIYVPSGPRPELPRPLVIALHGAGGDARGALAPLLPFADRAGLVLLAPESRGRTWDLMSGGLGPDVAFIDAALGATFAWHAVDPARVAIQGFSDGASYALSLGLANGDLTGHILAFSAGFSAPPQRRGRPRVFLSHGTEDQVLPITATSRKIVADLRRHGHEVVYREFDGPHVVPPEIAREALDWFLAPTAPR